MKLKKFINNFLLILFSALSFHLSALAGEISPVLDFQSARTLGLAGAGRGSPAYADTVIVNPAGLGFQEFQGGSLNYSWLNHQNPRIASTTQRILHGSVVDGRNPMIYGGLAFTRRPDLDLIHFILAKKLSPWISVGATAKRFSSRPAFKTIAGDKTGYDGGVSLLFIPSPLFETPIPLQIGVTLDNMLNAASNESFLGGRKLGVGARTSISDILYFYGDYSRILFNNVDGESSLSVAAELALGGGLYARGGIMRMHRQGWGAGGGWMGPKIGLIYGYFKRTGPPDGFEHALTMEFYM